MFDIAVNLGWNHIWKQVESQRIRQSGSSRECTEGRMSQAEVSFLVQSLLIDAANLIFCAFQGVKIYVIILSLSGQIFVRTSI